MTYRELAKLRVMNARFLLRLSGVVLCIPIAVACVLNGKPAQGPNPEAPAAGWEHSFFEELEKRTSKAGIADLRKTVLPGQDLEMRFWYDHLEVIEGLISGVPVAIGHPFISGKNLMETRRLSRKIPDRLRR